MAIHPTVLVSEDGAWRIEANPTGSRFTVYHNLRLQADRVTLDAVMDLLRENGLELGDLTDG